MDKEEKSKIEELKDTLYSRQTDSMFERKRHTLHPDTTVIAPKTEWDLDSEKKQKPQKEIPYKRILIISFLFFALTMAFAVYQFSIGRNTISNDKIDVQIKGPSQVDGGQAFPLEIGIKNKGTSVLKSATLKIEFPDGTKDPSDTSKELKRYTESLGDINPGDLLQKKVTIAIFGQENIAKKIRVIIEYRVEGSNAVFDKEKDYDILIGNSPLLINITGPEKISANQQTEFSVTVKSNSENILRGLLLKIEYPFGFNIVSSVPKPYSSDGSVFNIGDIEPGGERTVKFTGIIVGQDGEERTLNFFVGTPNKDNERVLGTVFGLNSITLAINKSSIGIDFLVNQENRGEIAVNPGDKLSGNISWRNNLPDTIKDMSISISFSGKLFDKTSVNGTGATFNAANNTLVFDKANIAQFASISPDQGGSVQFDFGTFSPSTRPDLSYANSQMDMVLNIYGNITGKNELLYSGKKIVKFSSSINLLSKGLRNTGSIENTGPFPPVAGQETSYTISWTASDTFNNINNGIVTANLAPNVTWTGITTPSNENISYDESTRKVTWNIGNMRSGLGSSYPAREVEFQVTLIPTVSQIGQSPDLISESLMTGVDSYTQGKLNFTSTKVTTELVFDNGYTIGSGKVVK